MYATQCWVGRHCYWFGSGFGYGYGTVYGNGYGNGARNRYDTAGYSRAAGRGSGDGFTAWCDYA
jgi:hypothetical protein